MPDESPEDAARELAAARRAMEMEFDAKMRDLKAQHTRRMERLKLDREEWEDEKRAQKKLVSDKVEQVKRRVDNAQQKVELGSAQRKELEGLRAEVKELERGKREAARRLADADARLSTAQGRQRSARLRAAAAVLLVGGAAFVASTWSTPTNWILLSASGIAAAWLVLGMRRVA